MELDKTGYVIKKKKSYLCMENDNLLFLDLANYLSRGISYAQFRASFADGESKGFWPYDYVTEISQLDEPLPHLPPHRPCMVQSIEKLFCAWNNI